MPEGQADVPAFLSLTKDLAHRLTDQSYGTFRTGLRIQQ
jgi:hypothetical protein